MFREKGLKEMLEDEGISPVVGAILMVAITVVLAAVILFFITGLADQPSAGAAGVTVELDVTTNELVFSAVDLGTTEYVVAECGSNEVEIRSVGTEYRLPNTCPNVLIIGITNTGEEVLLRSPSVVGLPTIETEGGFLVTCTGADFVVNQVTGVDDGVTPFRTIQAGVNAASAGDTVCVEGTYTYGPFTLTDPLTVVSVDGASLNAGGTSGGAIQINHGSSSPTAVSGFSLLNVPAGEYGVVATNVPGPVTLDSLTFDGNGIQTQSVTGTVTIQDVTATDFDDRAISLTGATNRVIVDGFDIRTALGGARGIDVTSAVVGPVQVSNGVADTSDFGLYAADMDQNIDITNVTAEMFVFSSDGRISVVRSSGYLGVDGGAAELRVEDSVFDQPRGLFAETLYVNNIDRDITIRDTELVGAGGFIGQGPATGSTWTVDNLTVRDIDFDSSLYPFSTPAALDITTNTPGIVTLSDVHVTNVTDGNGVYVYDTEATVTMNDVLVTDITNGNGLRIQEVNQAGSVQSYTNVTIRDVSGHGVEVENVDTSGNVYLGTLTFDDVTIENVGQDGFDLDRNGHTSQWDVTITNTVIDIVGGWGIDANSISPQTDATVNVTITNAGSGQCTGNVAC